MHYLMIIFFLLLSTAAHAAEFPTGTFKGVGFTVERGNQVITQADLFIAESSAEFIKLSDNTIQVIISARMQKTKDTPIKNDKRVDVFEVTWESQNSGSLKNKSAEFQDDKSSFKIADGKLEIRSWIARNQLWETHTYDIINIK